MKDGGSGVVQGRRGRPTASRAASIDAQILAAARNLFFEYGFEAVSMEAVAQGARVSKGTLYARHANKSELLRAMMAERIAAWSETAGASDHLLPVDLVERLRAHATFIRSARQWRESRQMQRLMRSIVGDFPELAAEWHELTFESFRRYLAIEIANAAAHDGLLPTDGAFFAELFLHALGGWTSAEDLAPAMGEADYQAFAENLIATVLLAARRSGNPSRIEFSAAL